MQLEEALGWFSFSPHLLSNLYKYPNKVFEPCVNNINIYTLLLCVSMEINYIFKDMFSGQNIIILILVLANIFCLYLGFFKYFAFFLLFGVLFWSLPKLIILKLVILFLVLIFRDYKIGTVSIQLKFSMIESKQQKPKTKRDVFEKTKYQNNFYKNSKK